MCSSATATACWRESSKSCVRDFSPNDFVITRMNSPTRPADYDVLIIGGGPAGATAGAELADFDLLLLNNTRTKGAEVREQTVVKRVLKDDGGRVVGVEAVGLDGETRQFLAPMTIDCSGREQVATAREGWRVKDSQLNKLAIWTYYRGAKRDPGIDEGNTTVAYVEGRGWFWYIPLKDDIVSVGIVAEKDYLFSESKDPATILAREVERNRWIKDHLEG